MSTNRWENQRGKIRKNCFPFSYCSDNKIILMKHNRKKNGTFHSHQWNCSLSQKQKE